MSIRASRPRNSNKEAWVTKIGLELLSLGESSEYAEGQMAYWRRQRLDDVKAEYSRLVRARVSGAAQRTTHA